MDILAELNPAQRQAVAAISGPVLILARPGSRKTRVIANGWLTLLPFAELIALIRQAKG